MKTSVNMKLVSNEILFWKLFLEEDDLSFLKENKQTCFEEIRLLRKLGKNSQTQT
jgi:hypothetical protein